MTQAHSALVHADSHPGQSFERGARSGVERDYLLIRMPLGFVLLGAALLKGEQLLAEPVSGSTLFTSRGFLVAVVEIEFFFGLWLVSGLLPRQTRYAAIAFFSVLAGIALSQALSGASSCGCFGSLTVSPWWALLFDLAAVVALLRSHGQRRAQPQYLSLDPVILVAVTAAALLGGVPAGLALARVTPAYLRPDGSITGNSEAVLLEPEAWIGGTLPLLQHIDIGGELRSGRWIVVLYRHDCARCDAVLPTYCGAAAGTSRKPGAPRIAVVDLAPYLHERASAGEGCVRGRLSSQRRWIVEPPLEITVKDGLTVSVKPAVGAEPLKAEG